jgi:hypothetical protein
MNVPNLPAAVALSIWMELTSKKKGPYELTIRVQTPNPDAKFEVRVTGEAQEARTPFPIFTPQVQYLIDREGSLKIYARFFGTERFELVKTQQIKYIPRAEHLKSNLFPTASQPPS